MKKAFTLAEIMIVLIIIGIITAIIMPTALNTAPSKNIMKFKKAHTTLLRVISELANSGKYYQKGNFGIIDDEEFYDGTHDGDKSYMCNAFAEMLSVKEKNCDSLNSQSSAGNCFYTMKSGLTGVSSGNPKEAFDTFCDNSMSLCPAIIKTSDNTSYIMLEACVPFGTLKGGDSERLNEKKDDNGFLSVYKIFCIDVDDVGSGTAPFGYGVRADGKIIPGARADLWLAKSVQDSE